MRGGIGGYPEIRRENEAGIKEVAARPDLNVMKRGREASITPGAWRRSSGGRKRGASEKVEKVWREHLRNADWAGMLPLRLRACRGEALLLGAVGM